MPRKRITDLAILGAALVLIAVLSMLRTAQTASQYSEPSTYDTGGNGYAALYDFLSREGVRVQRFERPLGELGRPDGTLLVAGDGTLQAAAASAGALAFLDAWVRHGGRLVVLDGKLSRAAQRALGLPPLQPFPPRKFVAPGCAFVPGLRALTVAGVFTGGYHSACGVKRATLLAAGSSAAALLYHRGRGTIALLGTPSVFDNFHLSQRGNARIAYALLGNAPVLFDERVHGYSVGRTFWEILPQPMRIAIAIALFAALLGIAGANLPFAPPLEMGGAEERDSSAYVDSIARMLERGGASREAVARITGRCEQVLEPRAAADEHARMLLRELRTLESTPRPGPHDVLAAGRIFARVRKEYGC